MASLVAAAAPFPPAPEATEVPSPQKLDIEYKLISLAPEVVWSAVRVNETSEMVAPDGIEDKSNKNNALLIKPPLVVPANTWSPAPFEILPTALSYSVLS